jgi:putative ABC transport system permease protein
MLTDLRHGFRSLLRSPGFTAVAVLTLALGIAATTAIFSIVETSLLHPLPFANPGRLVYLRESKMPQLPEFSVSPSNFLTWQAQTRSFAEMAALASRPFNLTGSGQPERLLGDRATANLFGMLGVRPVIGRDFQPSDDAVGAPPVLLLSYGLWQRRFGGDPSVLGRTVTLTDTDYTIVGVMPPAAQALRTDVALWVPMAFTDVERHDRYGSHYMRAIGRLKPGVTIDQARADLDVVARRLEVDHPDDDKGWRVLATPYEQYAVRDVRTGLLILIAAVGLVLLVACANVANLQLARGLGRHKELAIRAALGAGRGELVKQLVAESLVTATAGGAVGLLLAGWMLRALLALSPAQLPRAADVGIDLPALAFVLGVSMLALAIFGLVPALQVSRVDLRDALNTGGRGDRPGLRRRTRRALIVGEIAMATLLLVVSGLTLRSFVRVQQVDPGFVASGAIAAGLSLPGDRYRDEAAYRRFFTQLVERVSVLPGVTAAGVTESLPFFSDNVEGIRIDGRPPVAPTDRPSANYYSVTPDYFRAMGIRLVRGRLFTAQDSADAPRVAVINERFAKELFPGQDPLGERVEVSSSKGWREIVGIVADTKQYALTTDTTKQVYDPFAQHPMQGMTLVVRTASDPAGVAGPVRRAAASLDPDLPIGEMRTLSDLVAQSVAPERFSMLLLGAFAVSALFLAAIGLYSVISYSVSQRVNEVGIRMAHGARRGDIVWLVLREGLGLALLGVAIGLAGSVAAGRLMAGLLFHVPATDPATLAAVPAVLLAVAALACVVPAWRAARVDPIVTLRAV